MAAVHRAYVRACANRKRKAIIYSLCAGVATLLVGLNLIQILLICVTTWLLVWGLSTPRVRRLQLMLTLGDRKWDH